VAVAVRIAGKIEVTGVEAGLFRTRKGLVSEFWETELGMIRTGEGSSKGETAKQEGARSANYA
jgi:hypothetical protein